MAADNTQCGVGDLTFSLDLIAAKLLNGLSDMKHSFEVSLRQQAAMSIDRQFAADLDAAPFDKVFTFSLGAEAIIFQSNQRRNRKAIIDFGKVHLFG